jgi:hypothetical protein
MKYCKNCGHAVQGLYCSHCGQRTDSKRINFSFLWKEVLHFFTHLERGFLYTTLQMVIRPGLTVKKKKLSGSCLLFPDLDYNFRIFFIPDRKNIWPGQSD